MTFSLPTPYDVKELESSQWLVSQLEAYLLDHGHPQDQVNKWILDRLLESARKETSSHET